MALIERYLPAERSVASAPPQRGTMLDRLVRRIKQHRSALELTSTDPRFGDLIAVLSPASSTLQAVLRQLPGESRRDRIALAECLRRLLDALECARRLTLECELGAIAAGVPDRYRAAVIRRLGWDGRGGCTLIEAGESIGVTRERMRQICDRVALGLSGAGRTYLPTLDRALVMMASAAPAPARTIEARLLSEGLSGGSFRLEGLIQAASVFGRELNCVVVRQGASRLLLNSGQKGLVKTIPSIARELTKQWGGVQIADVIQGTVTRTRHAVPRELVTELLFAEPDFEWLDEAGGWFWLANVPRVRVVNHIRRVLCVVPTVTIADLRLGIARPYEMQGCAPTEHVLTEICKRLPECVVHGDVVHRSAQLSEYEDLSPMERICVDALRASGGIGDRLRIEEYCLAAGMSRSSFGTILAYAPWMTKHATEVYGLCGSDPNSEKAMALAHGVRRRRQRVKDHGLTHDGRIWLAIELSRGTVTTGCFSIPPDVPKQFLGTFEISDRSGVGVSWIKATKHRCSGLLPLFTTCGGGPGDLMVLLFDMVSRKIEARITPVTRDSEMTSLPVTEPVPQRAAFSDIEA